jgi:hypothetical protein
VVIGTTKLLEFPTGNRAAVKTSVTVLLPSLAGWVTQLRDDKRYPNLETVLAKSRFKAVTATSLDHRRFDLFKIDHDKSRPLPVASLCHGAGESPGQPRRHYYLRIDPVTLHADMSRLMLLRSGFGDLPHEYRQAVTEAIQSIFQAAGMTPEASGDCWTVALDSDPGVAFTSLDDSLGADISECLPETPAAIPWKKLMNEVQMALHALPLNEQRRQQGQPIINSIWIWGGGCLPENVHSRVFDLVYSADPVSMGLAKLQGSELRPLQDLPAGGDFSDAEHSPGAAASILLDWAVASHGSQPAPGTGSIPDNRMQLNPDTLDELCSGLLARTWNQRGEMCLVTPGQSWHLSAHDLLHFWKFRKPLASQLTQAMRAC